MASTTALPNTRAAAMRRTTTVDSTASTVANSPINSPSDSPTASASSTSLSSLGSVEDWTQETKSTPAPKLTDTYGNEFKIPDYTIKQIRDAIPKHCFERSAVKGLSYVARDMALLATTFTLFHNFCTPEYVPSYAARCVLWGVYTFLQGLFGTGLWVIAHECGHQSFSPSKTINDSVGWVLHSALLVPYFSWKISHSKHHKATGNMARDMVFVPRTREEHATRTGWLLEEMHELLEETPLYTASHIIARQLFGWPLYLIANVTGHNYHAKQVDGKGLDKNGNPRKNGFTTGINHFQPSSPLYEKRDEHLILLSDLGLLITGTVLYLLGSNFGWTNLAVWYGVPWLWVNHWLVAITYLQHTDPTLPHYQPESWNFVRGAGATIDREMGFIGRHLLHGIIETHVLHHYISTIPFYHADEATEAIKPVMGQHYRENREGGALGFIKSLWTSARWCTWVEPALPDATGEEKGVLFYRNRNGLGVPPAVISPAAQAAKKGMTVEVVEVSDSE